MIALGWEPVAGCQAYRHISAAELAAAFRAK